MTAGKATSPERIKEIVKMYRSGYTTVSIAYRFGLNYYTIINILKRNNEWIKRGGRLATEQSSSLQ